jgi:phage terminase small subunit
MSDKPMTPHQELFAQGVASGLSQSDAYRKAYPASLKWKDKTVHECASKLAANTKVSTRVSELQALSADAAVLDGAEIMREIKRVALSDIGGIIGANGKVLMPNELDAATRAAVAGFEIDEYGRVKYKFWDKNTALTNAAKIKGLFEVDNKQKGASAAEFLKLVTGDVAGPGKHSIPNDDDDDDN